jgi:hypothetical protein
MVKIQCRITSKSYLNGKRIYKYQQLHLPIPKKFHQVVLSFLELDLEMNLIVKGRKIFIELEEKRQTPPINVADVSRYF